MRFIPKGPDIPESLIRAHEEGNVVFFCGAGISYPAGLSGFDWLVVELYKRLGRPLDGAELTANKQHQYDAQLSLVERDLSEGRQTLRSHLPEILKPNTRRKHALSTHRALLELARDRDDRTRLVTTNFDRLFVKADKTLHHLRAPHLPAPKRSRWDGVVYLHGLMDESPSTDNLNSLVLTSGDFGLAYLNERWASRFVSELFAKYTVCFVGYSADDVVLRYMLDALSADELQGEKRIEVFALAGTRNGTEDDTRENWKVKGVTAILYDQAYGHAALHETLRSWAATYRDGLTGRRGVALRESRLVPDRLENSGSVDRLLWALNEPSGEIAKAFAVAEPAPSIEWLEVFSERKFNRADLKAFGIEPNQIPKPRSPNGEDVSFSLLAHPSAPEYAQWTSLVSFDESHRAVDNVSLWLAEWICRHLDKADTVLWVAKHGGRPHPRFRLAIQRAVTAGSLSEPYTRIWQVIAAGYSETATNRTDFFGWAASLPKAGIGTMDKLALAELLQPRVSFRRPFSPRSTVTKALPVPKRVRDIVDWEMTLVGGHPHDALDQLKSRADWSKFLCDALPMLTQSLLVCMELMALLGEATIDHDLSSWHQPSISPHSQNNRFNEWTTLVELCRDGWDAVSKVNKTLALGEFQRWRTHSYLVFRRLAMYAATSRVVDVEAGLELLFERNTLWLEDCKREAIRLLMHLAPKLSKSASAKILTRIVKGPPRNLYRRRLTTDDWIYIRDRTIWVRLSKWRASGASLPRPYARVLKRLDGAHPEWSSEPAERQEFRSWMSAGTGDLRSIELLPRNAEELAKSLTHRKSGFFETDDWSAICLSAPELARNALMELVRNNIWPGNVWREALNATNPTYGLLLTLDEFGGVISRAPDTFFSETVHSLPWWLRQQAATVSSESFENFFEICRRLIDVAGTETLDESDDLVGQAINHPIGRTVEAVILHWFSTHPKPGIGLTSPHREILGIVCGRGIEVYVPGIVIIAANLFSLYAADPDWTRKQVLPYFHWKREPLASKAAWEGYLWTPRIDQQLFDEMLGAFVVTVERYEYLGKHRHQFASLLVWTAMEIAEGPRIGLLASALHNLPSDGLAAAADALANSVANRGATLDDYLTNRVRRVYSQPWPKSANRRSTNESRALALFCVRTGEQFALWVKDSRPFLSQFPDIYLIIAELKSSGLCSTEPTAALDLLARIVSDHPYPGKELGECLTIIRQALPNIARRPPFKRLWEISQRQH
jgi:hypothetical protein